MNSKYFYRWINRRNKSGIEGLMINNAWVDSVEEIKREAHNHFSNHFICNELYFISLPENLFDKMLDEVATVY